MAKAGDGYLVGKIPEQMASPTKIKEYIEKSKKEISARQKKINIKVNDWYNFSTTPQTEDDIRQRLLLELKEGEPGKYVCLSYICRYSKLSEDFIEELIELTSTIRRKDYTPVNSNRNTKYNNSNRLDWKNICLFQKLSEEFIERHENDVLWDYIFQTQDLSEEFKKEHKHDYDKTSLIFEDSVESEDIH